MKRAMNDKALEFLIESEAEFFGVAFGGLHRDHYVAEMIRIIKDRFRILFIVSERKNVRGFVDPAKITIQLVHPAVPDKSECQRRLRASDSVERQSRKPLKSDPIDRTDPLMIDELDFSRRIFAVRRLFHAFRD